MTNRLRFYSTHIEILCDRNDTQTQYLAGRIPYVHKNRILTEFKTSIRHIDYVLKVFRGIDYDRWDELPPAVRKFLDAEIHRRIATKSLLELGPDKEDKLLWRHQQLGRELAIVNPRWAYYFDTRTGKTPMSLQIIQDDIVANPTHKWLILCPLILIENAWLPDAARMFPDLKLVSLHARTKDKRLAQFNVKSNIYVLNIESFVDYREHVEKLGIHGCIVDESSTMKSNSSKFGKEAVDFAWKCKRWYLLSGTPAPNGEWEYYRQLQSIDYYGVHESFNQFSKYFFDNTSRNPQYTKLALKEDRKEELLFLLREYSLYVNKEDVLETPGRDFKEISFALPEALRENYNELKQELALTVGDDLVITSPSTAANINKLNQVSSGFAIDTAAMRFNRMKKEHDKHGGPLSHEEFRQEVHLLSEYRFDILEKVLANEVGDNQAIIWAYYHEEFKIIKHRLGDKCGLVYGGVGITEKNKAIADFKVGKIKYLVANPASADKGLTLTNAHFAIYFSLGYSYEYWKQSIERIYGGIHSQPHRCTYYIFIAKNTVDRAIYTTVQNKGNMSMAILDHLKGGL